MQLIAILQLGWPQTLLCSYRQLYLVRMKHENIVAKTAITKSPSHMVFVNSLQRRRCFQFCEVRFNLQPFRM